MKINDKIPARQGVWTPFAEVLCGECHDGNKPVWNDKPIIVGTAMIVGDDDELLAHCDTCDEVIWIRDDIATLANLKRSLMMALYPVEMQQTGGMCSALVMRFEPPDHKHVFLLIITNMDGPFMLGLYRDDEDWEENLLYNREDENGWANCEFEMDHEAFEQAVTIANKIKAGVFDE